VVWELRRVSERVVWWLRRRGLVSCGLVALRFPCHSLELNSCNPAVAGTLLRRAGPSAWVGLHGRWRTQDGSPPRPGVGHKATCLVCGIASGAMKPTATTKTKSDTLARGSGSGGGGGGGSGGSPPVAGGTDHSGGGFIHVCCMLWMPKLYESGTGERSMINGSW
jgi:hypothetical protein